MKYQLIFLDTETTGGESQDRLLQLAYKLPDQSYGDMFNELYKPPLAISIESMVVHHITEQMVADKPLFKDSETYAPVKKLLESAGAVLVAHNAPFDVEMLAREDIKPTYSIDTLRIVRHLDPEMKFKQHNMQYLRYLLELDKDITETIHAHDAKGDVIILELLFKRLSAKISALHPDFDQDAIIAEMIRLSGQPTLIGKFGFGKHIGRTVAEVASDDPGYLRWLLQQKEQSEQNEEDWIFTLKHFLNT